MGKVKPEDKVKFISWFIKNNKMKVRETVSMLSYIKNDPFLIKNITFTDNVNKIENGISVSTTDSEERAFKFFNNGRYTTNVEAAFHHIRQYRNGKFYFQVNFPNKYNVMEYVAVHEEIKVKEEPLDLETVRLVKEIELNMNRKTLLKKIDDALDTNDMDKFMRTLELMEELKKDSVVY